MTRFDTSFLRGAVLAAAFAGLAGVVHAQEAGSRQLGLNLSGNEPIQIESDRLEVREAESIAIFTGNVNVLQGATQLKSGKMTVYYSNQGTGSATTGSSEIERLEVEGKVYVKSENQVATGDSGIFDMLTNELVLIGEEVVLTEGENVVVGCRLTVQMNTGEAQLEGCGGGPNNASGRVKMLLQPQSQQPRN